MYSEKVMDHFSNPRNVGEIEDADGIGQVGNAVCGDIMKIYLKIENDIIVDVKFKNIWMRSSHCNKQYGNRINQKGKKQKKRWN